MAMRTRQKWVGIIVVLATLLILSAGPGHTRGGGHRGREHGFHHRFHRGFHRFGGPRIGLRIGIGPFWAPQWGAYPYYPYPPMLVYPSRRLWI